MPSLVMPKPAAAGFLIPGTAAPLPVHRPTVPAPTVARSQLMKSSQPPVTRARPTTTSSAPPARVTQTLCRRIGGGRVAALEVLVVNHAIENLIREGKTSQLVSAMQTSRQEGNRLMNAELAALVKSGAVTREEALSHSTERKELDRLLGRPAETPGSRVAKV